VKKIILPAFLFLFLFSSTALAQIEDYGLKIGGQSTGVYSEQLEVDRIASFSIYGFADIKLTSIYFPRWI